MVLIMARVVSGTARPRPVTATPLMSREFVWFHTRIKTNTAATSTASRPVRLVARSLRRCPSTGRRSNATATAVLNEGLSITIDDLGHAPGPVKSEEGPGRLPRILVAHPERDSGIDLLTFTSKPWRVIPIQRKVATNAVFSVHLKYERIPNLVMVWNARSADEVEFYAMMWKEAKKIATWLRWTNTSSWGKEGYGTTRPSRHVREAIKPHKMEPGKWRGLTGRGRTRRQSNRGVARKRTSPVPWARTASRTRSAPLVACRLQGDLADARTYCGAGVAQR